MASKRITMTIDEELLEKLELKAKELSTSKCSLMRIYCSLALKADEEVKRHEEH